MHRPEGLDELTAKMCLNPTKLLFVVGHDENGNYFFHVWINENGCRSPIYRSNAAYESMETAITEREHSSETHPR